MNRHQFAGGGKGLAWHYKKYSSDTVLAKAENMARRLKGGFWKDGKAEAPWEWRMRIRN